MWIFLLSYKYRCRLFISDMIVAILYVPKKPADYSAGFCLWSEKMLIIPTNNRR